MNSDKRFHPVAELSILLEMLGVFAVLGLFYCALALAHGLSGIPVTDLLLYAIWFAITVPSVALMQRGDRWGAYALGASTGVVTVYEIFRGHASLGGASLGLIIAVLLYAYLRQVRPPAK